MLSAGEAVRPDALWPVGTYTVDVPLTASGHSTSERP